MTEAQNPFPLSVTIENTLKHQHSNFVTDRARILDVRTRQTYPLASRASPARKIALTSGSSSWREKDTRTDGWNFSVGQEIPYRSREGRGRERGECRLATRRPVNCSRMNEQVPSPLPPPLLSKPSSRTLGEIANRFRGRKESRKRENKRCIHVEKNSRPRRRIISSVKNYYSVAWEGERTWNEASRGRHCRLSSRDSLNFLIPSTTSAPTGTGPPPPLIFHAFHRDDRVPPLVFGRCLPKGQRVDWKDDRGTRVTEYTEKKKPVRIGRWFFSYREIFVSLHQTRESLFLFLSLSKFKNFIFDEIYSKERINLSFNQV